MMRTRIHFLINELATVLVLLVLLYTKTSIHYMFTVQTLRGILNDKVVQCSQTLWYIAHARMHILICLGHLCIHVRVSRCILRHKNTYTHTYMHAYTDAYVCTYIQTFANGAGAAGVTAQKKKYSVINIIRCKFMKPLPGSAGCESAGSSPSGNINIEFNNYI
jgi:hypothetical protein